MTSLHFPPGAAETLERSWNGESDSTELDKWFLYTLSSASEEDAKDVCHAAMAAYNEQSLHAQESEWEELGFIKPPNHSHPDLNRQNLQGVLEHHLALASRRLRGAEPKPEDDREFYLYGFVALTAPSWREKGLTVVHCDKDRGKWKVTSCSSIPVTELGMELTSVGFGDEEFDRVRERHHDGMGNALPDNQGGPEPVGEWQWLVLCSGIAPAKVSGVQRRIPDPRGDGTWPIGEECLWYLPGVVETGKLGEEFLVGYKRVVEWPYVPANPTVRVLCRRHSRVFVHVDNSELGERGVKIVSIEWDGDVGRGEEELSQIGMRAEMVVQRCEVDAVVATLGRMSQEFPI